MEESATVRCATFSLLKDGGSLWDLVYEIAQVVTRVKTDHTHAEKGQALLAEITVNWCAPFFGLLACLHVSSIVSEGFVACKIAELFGENFSICRELVSLPKLFLIGVIEAEYAGREASALNQFTHETFLPALTNVCSEAFNLNCLQIFFTAPHIAAPKRETTLRAVIHQHNSLESPESLAPWHELCLSGGDDTKIFAAALMLFTESGTRLTTFCHVHDLLLCRQIHCQPCSSRCCELSCIILIHHLYQNTRKLFCILWNFCAQNP